MARKVFISFLGTNNYVECRYQTDGYLSQPVRFVQEALIEHLCKDWTENDRIFIFCTSFETTGRIGSKESNWLDDGQPKASCEIEHIGLQHRLDDLCRHIGLKPRIVEKDIKAGFTENEIWDIFSSVFNKLQKDDRIYFDVTHAFRSIPLFATVLFNYARFMLGTQLASIHYGAFEQLGTIQEAIAIPVDERIAPIVDLTSIVRLQEYNQIASSLKDFGKAKPLSAAIHASQEDASGIIQQLTSSISQLDEYIETIDIPKIKRGDFIRQFRQNYKKAKRENPFVGPIQKIIDELHKETEDFIDADSFRNVEAAINWSIKHDMLMQAFPLAEEYIGMYVSNKFSNYIDLIGSSDRPNKKAGILKRCVIQLLGMPDEAFNNHVWEEKPLSDEKNRLLGEFLSKEETIVNLRPKFIPIREARNSLAHGNGRITYKELKKRIPNIIECLSILNPEYKDYPSTLPILEKYAH